MLAPLASNVCVDNREYVYLNSLFNFYHRSWRVNRLCDYLSLRLLVFAVLLEVSGLFDGCRQLLSLLASGPWMWHGNRLQNKTFRDSLGSRCPRALYYILLLPIWNGHTCIYLGVGTFLLIVFAESYRPIVPQVSYHCCHVRVVLLYG